jgi:hypothetical protein
MNRFLTLAVLTLALPLAACGKKKSDGTTTPGGSALAGDSETTTSAQSASMDESATALNTGDNAKSNAGSQALADSADANVSGAITLTRTCTTPTGGKDALVTLTYSGSASFVRADGKMTVAETAGGQETRDWTNTHNAVVCTATGQYAKIDWASATAPANSTASGYDGLSLADTTSRTRDLKTTFTRRNGKSSTREANYTEKGTRNVTWTAGTTAGTTTKTVYLDVTKTYTLTKWDGSTVDLSGEHTVDKATPLSITTERDTSGNPTKHTINSGTEAFNKAGSYYLTNVYSGVVFDLAVADRCTPTAGTITTTIYNSNSAADLANPVKTITIIFGTSGPSVTGGDDEATDTDNLEGAINHKCDLADGE